MTRDDRHIPRTRAVGTISLASEFLQTARSARLESTVEAPSFAGYFLLGHALELAFKATLIADGTTEKRLKRIGHDLVRACNASLRVTSDAVAILPEDYARIQMLSSVYKAKALEYLEPGFVRLPVPAELVATTDAIVSTVKLYVERRIRMEIAQSAV